MSVTANRTGNTGTVTIAFSIADILAMPGVSAAEKKVLAFQRAQAELSGAAETLRATDAELDQRVTDATAAAAALKAARPTGNL